MSENEEIIRAWIGSKKENEYYEKIVKGGISFNWIAFLIPDLFFLTRKMWAETFIYIMISMIISIITSIFDFSNLVQNLLIILPRIITGFSFYLLYKNSIKRKIRRNERKGFSYEQQIEDARKRGGDKITIAVVACFIIAVIEVLFFYMCNGMLALIMLNTENYIDDANANSSLIASDNNVSSWKVGDYVMTYDTDLWEYGEINGYQILKYKDEKNFIMFGGNNEIEENGLDIMNSKDMKNSFEDGIRKSLEESNAEYKKITYKQINSNLCLATVKCEMENTEGNIYYYITKDECYIFTEYEFEKSTNFEAAVEKLISSFSKYNSK